RPVRVRQRGADLAGVEVDLDRLTVAVPRAADRDDRAGGPSDGDGTTVALPGPKSWRVSEMPEKTFSATKPRPRRMTMAAITATAMPTSIGSTEEAGGSPAAATTVRPCARPPPAAMPPPATAEAGVGVGARRPEAMRAPPQVAAPPSRA